MKLPSLSSAVALALSFIPLAAAPTPPVDAQRIVNESYSFLRNREPEMTGAEYALYEKVVSLISTQPAMAMKLLESLMQGEQKVSPAFDFVLGNAYYTSNQSELAITHFRRAVEKFPDFTRAWTNLGIVYYTQQRHADAAPCFSKAVSLGDQTSSTYGLLGYCLARSGNPLGAEMAYQQAYALDPARPEWIEGLVELLLNTRQYARAEALQRQLVRLRPTEPRHWTVLAGLLTAQNRRLDAIAVLETGARVAPLDDATLLTLGDLYVQQEFHPEAVALYTQVMTRSPDAGAKRLLAFARSLAASGHATEAQRLLASLPASSTRELQLATLETRAALAEAQHDATEAQRAYESVLALDAFHGRALLALATLHRTAGRTSQARLLSEQAASLPDFAYGAQLELAQLALAQRDYPASVAHLKIALGLQSSPALQEFLLQVSALLPRHEN